MGDRLTELFSEWGHLGAPVLVATSLGSPGGGGVEDLIARSTRYCRDSSRLTWIILGWLTRHPGEIDPERLMACTREDGDESVLGFLCDAARERTPHPSFDRIIRECRPLDQEELFFHRVARSELASSLARQSPLPLFKRWNFVSNELSYL